MAYRVCIYEKTKDGYISGCGLRAAYNKHWLFCPYCGKRISKMLCEEVENENKSN